jgi:predicted ferric reductase
MGWVLLTVMIVIASQCRRKNYELFHYVHHFAWVYYIIATLHAWYVLHSPIVNAVCYC